MTFCYRAANKAEESDSAAIICTRRRIDGESTKRLIKLNYHCKAFNEDSVKFHLKMKSMEEVGLDYMWSSAAILRMILPTEPHHLNFLSYLPSIELVLWDPSPGPNEPNWFSPFSNLVLRERGCELFMDNGTATVVGTSSSLSLILKRVELQKEGQC